VPDDTLFAARATGTSGWHAAVVAIAMARRANPGANPQPVPRFQRDARSRWQL